MLDFGWSEMAIIALLALIVIGPKDLPRVLRTMGQFMRKARSLSREFQSGLNEVIREAELDDARKAIEKTRSGSLDREIRKALDPDDEVDKELRDVDRSTRDAARHSEAAGGAKTSGDSTLRVNGASGNDDDGSSSPSTPSSTQGQKDEASQDAGKSQQTG